MSSGKRKFTTSKHSETKKPPIRIETEEEEVELANQELEERKFYERILRELEFGDIFVIIRCFEQILEKENVKLTGEIVDKIGIALNKYVEKIFVPSEVAEDCLQLLGKFTESANTTPQLTLFASSRSFIDSVINIFDRCYRKYVFSEPIQGSFLSHTSYELTMYILLGVIENPVILARFISHSTNDQLKTLFRSLGSIIPVDILYLTQVLPYLLYCINLICTFD